ncbi:MAG: sensor histidine kinase [Caldilineae bacterium]|nr:MAG: sensor histidine kinase [Caldilineae bacterium]
MISPGRSLTFKLTLAFLAVALAGVGLIAFFVGYRTQREFNQFVLEQYQQDLVNALLDYYQEHGGWEGLDAIVIRGPAFRRRMGVARAPVTLADVQGRVIYGGWRYHPGQLVAEEDMKLAVPLRTDGQTVGWLLLGAFGPPPAESPEFRFLARVNRAILFGAMGAGLLALLLGIFLARTITRPVRALTEATRVIAAGALGHQVEVHARDEIGELAASFNQMSSDLARASEARKQMTADIAHDLRTPLSAILGFTEALVDGKLQGNPEIYAIMHEEALHLKHLIEDLRTLSLMDAGELSLNLQPCPPKALLERLAMAHAARAEAAGIDLRVEVPAATPPILADPDRMTQVLNNLISNALRFTDRGGEIVLSAQAEQGRVLIQVRDTGCGIAPEHLPHVFERFYRADPARSLEEGESGLGLAIARSLVEAQGGKIWVESTVGVGTTMFISLPITDESTSTPESIPITKEKEMTP